ncbi:hypothetical protein O6H91_06G120400 [Diphasiastrum complanatum]|uniref:Uncharacterized protein n=2 Tax=Diphasiastrum complanatum TaxID=34168 RepID=A0ACC2DI34_DIPCM|nr:hypothetical protein O6H91_06G120400 [Diphasiastrum complanatum]KAJ7553962.1 hypothetical protein O6H91_06G120400 [Diphasiastrum complanatum]
MAAVKTDTALILSVLVLNFVLYTIILGIGGWAFNELIDGSLVFVGNGASPYLAIFSVLTSVVGISSVISGLQTLKKTEAKAAAAAIALAAWGLTLISLGLASKQVHLGGIHSKKLKALEAFAIIVSFTQLLYLIIPHATLFMNSRSSPDTAPTGNLGKSDNASV